MTVRPPRPRRVRRRSGRTRDWLLVVIASGLLVVFGLRVCMAALDVQTWTLGWRLVDLPTSPLVKPLASFDPLSATPLGRLTVADLLAAFVAFVVSLLLLASLTIRRAP